MSTFSQRPRSRQSNVVVTELENEVLVYDLDRDQASCLNATAALVWKYADGATGIDEIAARMTTDLNAPVDARTVWYAVEQLGSKHLLEERIAVPPRYARMTRRDFLVKAGVVGAVVAIPVIVSLTAPMPAMAATCRANGVACTLDNQCCSGDCDNTGPNPTFVCI